MIVEYYQCAEAASQAHINPLIGETIYKTLFGGGSLKKIAIVIYLLTAIASFTFPCHAYETTTRQPPKIEQSQLSEDSKEIIYRDMVISLLVPYIQKEINNYYNKYLTKLPIIFPYSLDIINTKRVGGYRIQLEVIAHPFVGPMNTVGDDKMIIETGAFGSVEIKKFEHLKSYPLPWNWQHIMKKPY
jgi:hypothetical protein